MMPLFPVNLSLPLMARSPEFLNTKNQIQIAKPINVRECRCFEECEAITEPYCKKKEILQDIKINYNSPAILLLRICIQAVYSAYV